MPILEDPDLDEIEALFVNNEPLSRIQAYLKRFNPIATMRMERMEIRHSAILSWLLDPSETHGLEDRFLKSFLSEALRGQSSKGGPTAIEVAQADLRGASIRREWKDIDIFILSESHNWAFIIENKFDSSQTESQLAKYTAKVRSIFQDRNNPLCVRGIFLTLWDEEPKDPEYSPINYAAVCELLARFMSQEASLIGLEVRTFLLHYLDILKDATGMSEKQNEMKRLARELYRDHRKVLEFVIEHGASTDFAIAARQLFGEDSHYLDEVEIESRRYIFSELGNHQLSFLPSSWYNALGKDNYSWPDCEDWWAGYPVIAWFEIQKKSDGSEGQLKLLAEVGRISDYNFRKSLIRAIQDVASERKFKRIRFQAGADAEGKRYSRFLKDNSLDLDDVNDPEEIAKAMVSLLRKFKEEFEAIASVLPKFKEYGRKGD